MEKGKIPCTVHVLTYNSAKTIERCLRGLSRFDDILILDGGSTDGTTDIAQRFGARIEPPREGGKTGFIEDFAAVRNRALGLSKHPWIFYLDSDEYVESDFADAAVRVMAGGPAACKVPRLAVYRGSVIRSPSTYPNFQIRFFYRDAVFPFKKKVHERVTPKADASVRVFPAPLYVPLDDLTILSRKWSRYLDHQMRDSRPTFTLWFLKVRANVIKFLKYMIKTVGARFFGKPPHMPLAYEWENARYHLRIISRVTAALVKKYVHDN